MLNMTPVGLLGRKTSTQTRNQIHTNLLKGQKNISKSLPVCDLKSVDWAVKCQIKKMSPVDLIVPRLFEEKWRDTVFGFPWGVVRGAWRVVRGAWRVVRGAWFRVFSGYFVP